MLQPGAQFRVRGRVQKPGKIFFGFSTHHPHGGFAGKYSTHNGIDVDPAEGAVFDMEVPVSAFKPEDEQFPASPLGLETIHWWAVSFDRGAGLEILDVELKPTTTGR